MHPFADRALAARLEAIVARDIVRFGETAAALYPDLGVDTLCVGGGAALWMGVGSPVNVAVGLGMTGPVTDDDLQVVEEFYESHDSRTQIAVCPLADESIVGALARRGYVPSGFENVLAVSLVGLDPAPADGVVEVREVTDDVRETWARTVAAGFSDSGIISPAEEVLARVIAHRDDAVRFLAYVDGSPAGTGELVITDGVGWLSADTTLPAYRGRGVQTALQVARLEAAVQAGCELAVTESSPGSGSQRNMERRGFRVAYTRVEVAR